jgi:hypothetical protein
MTSYDLNKTATANHNNNNNNNSATCPSFEKRGSSSMATTTSTWLAGRLTSSTVVGLTPVPQTHWNCLLQFRLQFLLHRRP